MSQEVRNPQKTLPRAVYASGVLIAGMYIVATVAVLALVPAAEVIHTQRRVSRDHGGIDRAENRCASGLLRQSW